MRKNLIRAGCAVLLLLAALELLLRFAGFLLLIPSKQGALVGSDDAKKLRILAIGESTTAFFFADGNAWPERLQTQLQAAGVDARVYNLGLGGTTTAMIASEMPEYLEKYKPQIVIAMMGVNDPSNLIYDGSSRAKLGLMISQMRLVKLTNLVFERVNSLRFQQMDYSYPNETDVIAMGRRLASMGVPISKVEESIRRRTRNPSNLNVALILSQIAKRLRFDPSSGQSALSLQYSARAYELYPFTRESAYWQISGLQKIERLPDWDPRLRKIAGQLLRCGPNLSDDLISLIAPIAFWDPTLASNPIFKSRGLSLGSQGEMPTQKHYNIIWEMVKASGAKLIAMQYPTLSVKQLTTYFEDDQGKLLPSANEISFVSNEENFKNALGKRPYEDLFRDRFRGTWGHTTAAGHELIAQSAFEAVRALLKTNVVH